MRTENNTADIKWDNKAGMERDNNEVNNQKHDNDIKSKERDDETDTKRDNNRVGVFKQDNERAEEIVEKTHKGAQKLSDRVFHLTACSNSFDIFSS